ncbi:MAG: tetratricopeptide repeat protein, partial [Candidatus Neomarinimicrobiota bacterium]
MKTAFLLIFSCTLIFSGCGLFTNADKLYSLAQEKREIGNHAEALEILEKIVRKYSQHEIAANSQYLIAEIYYVNFRDFKSSIENYEKLSKLFPLSEKVPHAHFMQGFIYANMLSEFEKAEKVYSEFLKLYPHHELIPSVEFELEFLGKDIEDIPI